MTTKFALGKMTRKQFLGLASSSAISFLALYFGLSKSGYSHKTVVQFDSEIFKQKIQGLDGFYSKFSNSSLAIFNQALENARNQGHILDRRVTQVGSHTFMIETQWLNKSHFLSTYSVSPIQQQLSALSKSGISITSAA